MKEKTSIEQIINIYRKRFEMHKTLFAKVFIFLYLYHYSLKIKQYFKFQDCSTFQVFSKNVKVKEKGRKYHRKHRIMVVKYFCAFV